MAHYGFKVRPTRRVHIELYSQSLGQRDRNPRHLRLQLPYSSFCGIGASRRRCIHSLPSMQEPNIDGPSDTPQRHHSFRQERHLPQAGRMVHSPFLLDPHDCALEELVGVRPDQQPRIHWIPSRKLRNRPGMDRLRHVDCAHGYVLDSRREESTGPVRALLVHAPPVHRLLPLLGHTRCLLHDQAGLCALLRRYRCFLGVLDVWRIRVSGRAYRA